MKRYILIFTLLAFGYLAQAQCTLPYKPLSSFANDTTAFINYNFSDRAGCYTGKTLNDLLQDIGIPIKSFLVISFWETDDAYRGIYIYVYPYNVACQRTNNKDYSNIIAIEWADPLVAIDIDSIADKLDPYKWTPQIENILKNRVIKDIGIINK
jgi:hypothetical protein